MNMTLVDDDSDSTNVLETMLVGVIGMDSTGVLLGQLPEPAR